MELRATFPVSRLYYSPPHRRRSSQDDPTVALSTIAAGSGDTGKLDGLDQHRRVGSTTASHECPEGLKLERRASRPTFTKPGTGGTHIGSGKKVEGVAPACAGNPIKDGFLQVLK